MNTVTINSNVYRGAEQYANLHNISVADAVEKAIKNTSPFEWRLCAERYCGGEHNSNNFIQNYR